MHRETRRGPCDVCSQWNVLTLFPTGLFSANSEQLDMFKLNNHCHKYRNSLSPWHPSSSSHTLCICITPHFVDSLLQLLVKTNPTSSVPLFFYVCCIFVASSCHYRTVFHIYLHNSGWLLYLHHYRRKAFVLIGIACTGDWIIYKYQGPHIVKGPKLTSWE